MTASQADIAPAHALLWAMLVYGICTIALGLPALAGKFLVSPLSDQFIGGFPVRDFAAASLKAGNGIPQWNPYLFGGLPYVAAMHGDIFYPTFLLRTVLPTDIAMTWSFMTHVFLAGLFTYLFLRRCGLSFIASLVGGLAYMMGGPIASLVTPGHDGKLYVSALLPLALLLLTRGIREGRASSWGLLAVVIGLGVLSPHPQLLQYMLLCCGAFSLYLAFGSWRGEPALDRRVALRRLAFALGSVGLGMVMGAVQYLPVMEYVPWSPRAGGRDYQYATSFSMPLEELFNTYLPQFTGILERYWGRNPIHLHSEYLGASVLMLAGAAFGGAQRAFRRFWLVVLIVAALWALGGSTPFYHVVYAIVPGSKFFRAPSTIFFVAAFAIAVLAALGTERIRSGEIGAKYLIGWVSFGAVVALLASAGGLTNLARAIHSTSPYVGSYRDGLIDENTGALIAGAWRSFLFVGVAALVVWGIRAGRLPSQLGGWALVALIALDLFSVERQYWRFSEPASRLYASDPAIDRIRNGEPGRVLSLVLGKDAGPRDPYFEGDGMMVHQVRSALGYHGNELGLYQRLAGKSATTDYSFPTLLSPPFWRHENVRYLYTTADDSIIQLLSQQLRLDSVPRKLVGPVTNAAGSTVYLFRLPGDNPPAWLATAAVKGNDDQAVATVLDPRFDPTRVAIVDSAATVPAASIQSLPAPTTTRVTLEGYEPGRIKLQLQQPSAPGAVLVMAENYFPGWEASVDGRAASVARTDFNLIGVPLPAGARKVELTFRDHALERGRFVTVFALLLAAVLAALGIVAERRRPSLSAQS